MKICIYIYDMYIYMLYIYMNTHIYTYMIWIDMENLSAITLRLALRIIEPSGKKQFLCFIARVLESPNVSGTKNGGTYLYNLYVREKPPPKQPKTGSVPAFWLLETFGDSSTDSGYHNPSYPFIFEHL